MTRLSPRHRDIVELVGREHMTYPEVAETLGIHISTVKVHISRIVERSGLDLKPRAVLTRLYWTEVASAEEPTGS